MLKPLALTVLAIIALAGCVSSPEASEAPSNPAAPAPSPSAGVNAPSEAVTGNGVSDIAYGFALPNATGPGQSLASYRGAKNVVVVFYRAFW